MYTNVPTSGAQRIKRIINILSVILPSKSLLNTSQSAVTANTSGKAISRANIERNTISDVPTFIKRRLIMVFYIVNFTFQLFQFIIWAIVRMTQQIINLLLCTKLIYFFCGFVMGFLKLQFRFHFFQ